MKTGNTPVNTADTCRTFGPQWSPVMKTGNTWGCATPREEDFRLNGARS